MTLRLDILPRRRDREFSRYGFVENTNGPPGARGLAWGKFLRRPHHSWLSRFAWERIPCAWFIEPPAIRERPNRLHVHRWLLWLWMALLWGFQFSGCLHGCDNVLPGPGRVTLESGRHDQRANIRCEFARAIGSSCSMHDAACVHPHGSDAANSSSRYACSAHPASGVHPHESMSGSAESSAWVGREVRWMVMPMDASHTGYLTRTATLQTVDSGAPACPESLFDPSGCRGGHPEGS